MTLCDTRPSRSAEESFTNSLITEISTLLSRLAETGEAGAVDLHSLPLSQNDRAELEAFLGQGEVNAKLSIAGTSEVRETKYPGVWWICHRGADDRITNEVIEITLVPEILKTHRDDLPIGLQRLGEDIDSRQFDFQSGENE